MEFIYPAKFTAAKEGGYTVTFPDFRGAVTEGDDLKEAFDMAEDCLGGLLAGIEADKKKFPEATTLTAFPANDKNEFINLIKVDLTEYKRRVNDKPVKKTVYIPKGLNDRAEELGVNFSRLLRDALTQEIRP
ncbi:MAG: type II toxin-antitoxin system HicB family antitoxin [Clostridiales bacterium]|jgi:predicted RNase H-like HicB family nuclease|nr:type II toxin-antitoxin system HicB family antitoxin [Clostridiales bacterium]